MQEGNSNNTTKGICAAQQHSHSQADAHVLACVKQTIRDFHTPCCNVYSVYVHVPVRWRRRDRSCSFYAQQAAHHFNETSLGDKQRRSDDADWEWRCCRSNISSSSRQDVHSAFIDTYGSRSSAVLLLLRRCRRRSDEGSSDVRRPRSQDKQKSIVLRSRLADRCRPINSLMGHVLESARVLPASAYPTSYGTRMECSIACI